MVYYYYQQQVTKLTTPVTANKPCVRTVILTTVKADIRYKRLAQIKNAEWNVICVRPVTFYHVLLRESAHCAQLDRPRRGVKLSPNVGDLRISIR